MARANTITKLPLERWAEIMGIHPFHFNGLGDDDFLANLTCGMTWFQYSWQNADRISREEIAQAIRDAEDDIEGMLGYHLLPVWDVGERIYFTRPALRDVYNLGGYNVRGQRVSIKTRWGHVLYGGQRTKTGIETSAVVRSDVDGDGFEETCTVTVATSVDDADEIRIYLPDKDFADEYEIRPIKVALDTALDSAVITFKIWQIVKPELNELLDAAMLEATTAANFETEVDVVRVYNDPSTQVQFIWEQDTYGEYGCGTCVACQLGTQTGCFHNRDARLGMIVPSPAEWSADDQNFTKKYYSVCRAPDQMRVWYLSGNRDNSLDRPLNDMEQYWEFAVAYLAAAKLQKPSCGCDTASSFIEHWQEMREFSSRETGTYFQTMSQLTNPLGSTNGAKYALEKISKPGRRLGTQR